MGQEFEFLFPLRNDGTMHRDREKTEKHEKTSRDPWSRTEDVAPFSATTVPGSLPIGKMNRINWKLPLLLYVLTWFTTTGFRLDNGVIGQFLLALVLFPINGELAFEAWSRLGTVLWFGLQFSGALMFILTCHELGHYIQTRRYGVESSLPYFIPMPIGPFGTLGAVIAMNDRIPNRRALFDIGISGPLAGLVPTLFCLYFGIQWSYFGPRSLGGGDFSFGEPLLFQWFSQWIYGPMPHDMTLYAHPVAMAGWVGLFLTSLNLMPFSQLDGGHVFYALLGRRAARFSWAIFYGIILLVVAFQLLQYWALILVLLALLGVAHPPTADDSVPLTPTRRVLGFCTLAIVFLGLTPTPITINEPKSNHLPKFYCITTIEKEMIEKEAGASAPERFAKRLPL